MGTCLRKLSSVEDLALVVHDAVDREGLAVRDELNASGVIGRGERSACR